MVLDAPADKQKTTARVNWLLRQLAKTEPTEIHVRARWPKKARDTQETLERLRENPSRIEGDNKALVPARFEILLVRDLAGKFAGAKTFIENLEGAVPHFYEQVGQHLRSYVAPPPRVRRDKSETEVEREAEEPGATDSTAPAGPDGGKTKAPKAVEEIAEASETTTSDASEAIQDDRSNDPGNYER